MDYRFDFENEDYDSFLKFIKKAGLTLNCPVIHIAGSNGKSSTANILAHIYKEAGYHVGLFLNRFVSHPCEMIAIDGNKMDSADFSKIEAEFAKLFDKFDLSAFQRAFAIALSYFAKQKLDICIVETGLGGSSDATTIHYPNLALAIISTISLEHTSLLGTTLSQIGIEKCGILMEKVPVLFAKLDETCKPVMVEHALSLSCPIHDVDEAHHVHFELDGFHFDYGGMHDLVLKSKAQYDIENAALALEAVAILQHQFKVSEEAIRKGLKGASLPGHFEIRNNIIFDVAENPNAIEALVKSLRVLGGNKPIHAIFASLRGHNIAVNLPLLDNYVNSITLTTFDDDRARNEDDYALFAPDYEAAPTYQEALEKILEANPDSWVLVTGSEAFVYSCMKE